MIFFTLVSSLLLILFSLILFIKLRRITSDNEKGDAHRLSDLVSDGLAAYSKRVWSSVIQIIVYLSVVLLFFKYGFNRPFLWDYILGFASGGILMCFSAVWCIRLGPRLVLSALQRSKKSLSDAIVLLHQGSSMIGFLMMGLLCLGLSSWYWIFGTEQVIGFGVGVLLSAFFLRVGGSVFKTGTDIGEDIAGNISKEIPEFDARNPATILDITGDYVGNIMGFGADIIGSYIFVIIACLLFPTGLLRAGVIDFVTADKLMMLPLFIMGLGVVATVISYGFGRLRAQSKIYTNFLLEGLYIAVFLCGVAMYFFINYLDLHIDTLSIWGSVNQFRLFEPYVLGLLGAILISFSSEFLTSNRFRPAQLLARKTEFGPVIVFLGGLARGFNSNGLFLIYFMIVALPSFYFSGFYGIAMAALGMLSCTGIILNCKIFSPLSSNAYKIALLTQQDERIISNTKKINKIGTTTIALGNGLAAGAAVISTFALFFSLVLNASLNLENLFLVDVPLLSGLILGIMIPFLFMGTLIRGLIKTVLGALEEATRQFREIPYLVQAKAHPDVLKASDTNARFAMDSLILPGIIMLLVPIFMGFLFGVKMLIGIVLGTLLSGFSQNYAWANLGDALHNVRHYILNGHCGGKQSPNYAHISTADNIGDAFKDLLSPSINILMKAIVITAMLIILI